VSRTFDGFATQFDWRLRLGDVRLNLGNLWIQIFRARASAVCEYTSTLFQKPFNNRALYLGYRLSQ
jgi:hypothetical protein